MMAVVQMQMQVQVRQQGIGQWCRGAVTSYVCKLASCARRRPCRSSCARAQLPTVAVSFGLMARAYLM
jgi:hypothetical protein